MVINPSPKSIAEYCQGLLRGEIRVNKDYQRSDQVWPEVARSFLIETILLEYPIPKFFLFQEVDLRSRLPQFDIVDGQQRTAAIKDFYDDKFVISTKLDIKEIAGLKFSELPEDYQEKFLHYSLSIDVFVSATSAEVREVFRRMNSYTYPLNPEEQRHANYQGQFKWFIHSLRGELDKIVTLIGTFKNKSLVRMADAKLYTEIVHAILNGIGTTRKSKLDSIYKEFDKTFDREDELKQRIVEAFETILAWTEIHNTELVKHYIVYALVLAIMHLRHPEPTLQGLWNKTFILASRDIIIRNLLSMSDLLGDPENAPSEHRKLVEAFSVTTNVKERRETRFIWCCEALTGQIQM